MAYKPIETIDKSPINHSYWTYVHQLYENQQGIKAWDSPCSMGISTMTRLGSMVMFFLVRVANASSLQDGYPEIVCTVMVPWLPVITGYKSMGFDYTFNFYGVF